jgi:ketosteroid isomerase-like protein
MSKSLAVLVAAVVLVGCAPSWAQADVRLEVLAAERAFAQTMDDRDHETFASFIAEEAIFFGPAEPLRGKQQVVEGWAPFFDGADAPFSWEPQTVEVLASGTLALSSGPVRNKAGEAVAQFTSIWRRESDGAWRVVFDKGCDLCAREAAGKPGG